MILSLLSQGAGCEQREKKKEEKETLIWIVFLCLLAASNTFNMTTNNDTNETQTNKQTA